jgi:hypothetical protein
MAGPVDGDGASKLGDAAKWSGKPVLMGGQAAMKEHDIRSHAGHGGMQRAAMPKLDGRHAALRLQASGGVDPRKCLF